MRLNKLILKQELKYQKIVISKTNFFIFFNKLLVVVFLLTPLYGCNKKQPLKEVVSIEEFLGEELAENDEKEEELKMPELDGTFVSKLSQKLYQSFSFETHHKTTLIDRFSYENSEKSLFMSLSDSNAVATFFKYDFIDTSATHNAFNNWLSCFGDKCEEVKLEEVKVNVKESPLWCGVFDRSIVIVKFSDSALSHKNQLKQAIFQSMGLPLKYTLNVTSDNVLKWE